MLPATTFDSSPTLVADSRSRGARRPGASATRVLLFLLALAVFVTGFDGWALAQQASIGVVKVVKGRVDATRDGTTALIRKDDELFQGDVLQTGIGGRLGAVFTDGSTFSMDENAIMVIDEMVFDPAQGTGRIALNTIRGLFSVASGAVSRNTAEGMTVRTPVMNIGIRGTVDNISAAPVGETNQALVVEGSSRVYNNVDSKVITTGQKAETEDPNQPIRVDTATPQDQQKYEGVQQETRELEKQGDAGGGTEQLMLGQLSPQGVSAYNALMDAMAAARNVLDNQPAPTAGEDAISAWLDQVESLRSEMWAANTKFDELPEVQALREQSPGIDDLLDKHSKEASRISQAGLKAQRDIGGQDIPDFLLPRDDQPSGPTGSYRTDGKPTGKLHDIRNISGYNFATTDSSTADPGSVFVCPGFVMSYNNYFTVDSDGNLSAGTQASHSFNCQTSSGLSCSSSGQCTFSPSSTTGSVLNTTATCSGMTYDATFEHLDVGVCATKWE